MKKLIFLLLIIILGKFTFAVVNVHQPGSHQWHIQNQMLAGQLEHDRRMAEQRAAQQYQKPKEIVYDGSWSAFVWNDKTGKVYYLSNEWIVKGTQKTLVKKAKKIFSELYGEKANQHLLWDGGLAIIVMGIDKNTGKIVAFADNDLLRWGTEFAEEPDMKAAIERDALERCSAKAYNCEIMYRFE